VEPVTDQLVDHSPDRDEKLIQHIMDIFAKGVLK
jgi:TetR/AcrR family transcriptional regulator